MPNFLLQLRVPKTTPSVGILSYLCWHERTKPPVALLLRIDLKLTHFLSSSQEMVSLQLYALCLQILKYLIQPKKTRLFIWRRPSIRETTEHEQNYPRRLRIVDKCLHEEEEKEVIKWQDRTWKSSAQPWCARTFLSNPKWTTTYGRPWASNLFAHIIKTKRSSADTPTSTKITIKINQLHINIW